MTTHVSDSQLGKYRLIATIAQGGMGIVYLAVAQGPGGFSKLVVLKELKPDLVEDSFFLAMFLDEARLSARLNHRNIVQTNEVNSDGNRYFMVMEYLDGQSLHRVLNRFRKTQGGFSLSMHLRILVEVLAGLQYAHDVTDIDGSPLDVVHRDISPHNIFVTYDGQVKIVDFGIAKALNASQETCAGLLKGKVAYMAPEQARGDRVDRRADVFSVGVLMWEALTGRRLWHDRSDTDVIKSLLEGDFPTLRSVTPTIAPELEAICARAMAPNREERYPTADAMRSELERYLVTTGESLSLTEIGETLCAVFHADRDRVKALIETHLMHLQPGDAGSEPSLVPLEPPPTPSVPSPSLSGSSFLRAPAAFRGSSPASSTGPSMLPPRQSLAVQPPPPSLQDASASLLMIGGTTLVSSKRRRSVNLWYVAIALLAGAVIIMAVVMQMKASRPPAMVSSAPSSVVALSMPVEPLQAPPAVTAKPETIQFTLRVTPLNARVFLDDTPLGEGPFTAQYPKDKRVHSVRVTANGFATKTEDVVFNSDMVLDLSLTSSHQDTGVHPPRGASGVIRNSPLAVDHSTAPVHVPITTNSASSDIDPHGGKKPIRSIETSNPYITP